MAQRSWQRLPIWVMLELPFLFRETEKGWMFVLVSHVAG
jgi:hypothetical protein